MGKSSKKMPNGTVLLYINMAKEYQEKELLMQRAVAERNRVASAMMMVATKFQRTVNEEFPRKIYLPNRGDKAILVTYKDDKNHMVEIVSVDIEKLNK